MTFRQQLYAWLDRHNARLLSVHRLDGRPESRDCVALYSVKGRMLAVQRRDDSDDEYTEVFVPVTESNTISEAFKVLNEYIGRGT